MKNGKQSVVREITAGSPVASRPALHLIPISANMMAKLSKHLAFLACLMILAQASGRAEIGQFGIFIFVVLATLAHSAERALRRRLPERFPVREE